MATQLTCKGRQLASWQVKACFCGLARILCMVYGLLFATSGKAQDVFDLFGTGAEVKAHAGAGLLASRGPAANYYNPANLLSSKTLTPYGELDFVNVNYSYSYPGLEPIAIDRTTPIPLLGLTWKPIAKFALGFSLLPLPATSSEQKVEGLPTRRVSEDPIIVNVEQKGKGFGYRFSLGGAYEVAPHFAFGLSLLSSASGLTSEARDAITNDIIFKEDTSLQTFGILLGAKASTAKKVLSMAVALKLPATTKVTGHTEIPPLGANASTDKAESRKGPIGIGFGATYRLLAFRPFFEFVRSQWSGLRSQATYSGVEKAKVDYFDTNDLKLGFDLSLGIHRFTFAVAAYQSYLGDGHMKSSAAGGADLDLVGLEFQNVDAIPHQILAGGYHYRFDHGSLQSGFSYLTGSRDVASDARGYGTYTLRVIQLIFGGTYAL